MSVNTNQLPTSTINSSFYVANAKFSSQLYISCGRYQVCKFRLHSDIHRLLIFHQNVQQRVCTCEPTTLSDYDHLWRNVGLCQVKFNILTSCSPSQSWMLSSAREPKSANNYGISKLTSFILWASSTWSRYSVAVRFSGILHTLIYINVGEPEPGAT